MSARAMVGLGDDAQRDDLLAELLHLRRHDEVEQRLREGAGATVRARATVGARAWGWG